MVVHEPWQERIAESIKRKFRGKIKVQLVKVDSFDAKASGMVLKALK
jgi:hypothetical protein